MNTPQRSISDRIDALFRAIGDLSLLAEEAGHPLRLPDDETPVA